MTKTILGANGKLGRMLARSAARAGLNWRTQARRAPADIVWSGAFTDDAVQYVLQPGSTVINMIGATHGSPGDLHRLNADFALRLLHAARDHNVGHVMLASSAAVYGGGDGATPFTEDAAHDPQTSYAQSKCRMEDLATTFAANNAGPAITILRIGNVAGADALTDVAHKHVAKGTAMPLHRLASGTAPLRSYIGPDDLFRAVDVLSAKPADGPRIVNIAHPQPVPLDTVLTAYRDHLMPDLKWIDTPAPDIALPAVTLATARLQRLLSFPQSANPAADMASQVAAL